MQKFMSILPSALLILVGIALLLPANNGLINFNKPYLLGVMESLPEANPIVAFEHVKAIPMDNERMLADQTVIVREGIIDEIGASGEVRVPPGAQRIDGTGKYLLPGLVDMHVHIEDENDLLLYAANGVTTVRNLWGNSELKLRIGMPNQLEMRDQIAGGELFGPTIYTSGPIMEGDPPNSPLMPVVRSPEDAVKSIAWQKAQGYDLVKVYDNLSPETYAAVLQAARDHEMPVVGHVPFAVGLEAVMDGGQVTIEHLSGYIDSDAGEFIIPEDQLADYAELTQEAGVWNIPTIGLYQNTVPADDVERLEAQPGVEYFSPVMRVIMRMFIGQLSASVTYAGEDYPERIEQIYLQTTRALNEAGAKVALGTDATNSYLVPGFSLHDELGYLIQAGFTPFEAIEAGTRNAAGALGKSDEFGTIEPGKRADLILVSANPLDEVSHLRNREGVMLRGRWLTQASLQALLDDLAGSYTPTVIERLWPLGLVAVGVYLGLSRRAR